MEPSLQGLLEMILQGLHLWWRAGFHERAIKARSATAVGILDAFEGHCFNHITSCLFTSNWNLELVLIHSLFQHKFVVEHALVIRKVINVVLFHVLVLEILHFCCLRLYSPHHLFSKLFFLDDGQLLLSLVVHGARTLF